MQNKLKKHKEESEHKKKDSIYLNIVYSGLKDSEKKESSLSSNYIFQQPWKILSSEKSVFNTEDYFTKSPQNLINLSINDILMVAIKNLESNVEKLSEKIENLSESREIKRKDIKKERIYIYFKTRDEGVKILNYCQRYNLDVWPVASGTLKIPYSTYVSKLRNAGFNFKTTNTLKTINDNKKFIESHKKQVEEHYNL